MRSSTLRVLATTMLATTMLAATSLALSACDTGPRPTPGVLQEPVPSANQPNITIDGSLQKFLVADYGLIVFKPASADSTLFVQVPVRSQADNQFSIQYNFTFFAADGRQVGETGHRLAVLDSRRQIMLSSNAIVREAVAYRLDIRSAR